MQQTCSFGAILPMRTYTCVSKQKYSTALSSNSGLREKSTFMPVTRSSTRTALQQSRETINHVSQSPKTRTPKGKARTAPVKAEPQVQVNFTIPPRVKEPTLIPAALSFSFQEAKQHLIFADLRFADVFNRLPCGPYEKLEPVDPFK